MVSCAHRHPEHLKLSFFNMYFILYTDSRAEWRWTLKSPNHEPICVSSEGYTSKQSAVHSISLVKAGASSAKTYDDSTKSWS